MSKSSCLISLLAVIAFSPFARSEQAARTDDYADFNPGKNEKGSEFVQSIVFKEPALRAEVKGDVTVAFQAPGMTIARALCWQQPTQEDPNPFGHDVLLADLKLDEKGEGSFVFPAEKFPHGPITVRIQANNEDKTRKDQRELQLYNLGGVSWNEGIPKTPPPAAAGMKLVFEDDFNGPLSISRTGKDTLYSSHKPGGGDFSGYPFSDIEGRLNPFAQVDTYLRIRASKGADGKSSSGILASVDTDYSGLYMEVPFYTECRLMAQSAPGTWPAFWTLTYPSAAGTDELDILEAYGGYGKGHPNSPNYSTTSHFWRQKGPNGKPLKAINKSHPMLKLGSKASWSTTFHTYGLKVTEKDTIYYLDGIETTRHPTNAHSLNSPHFFLINYAIGGISGWKIDLRREGNTTDMYVDYVRVYSSKPLREMEALKKTPAKASVTAQGIGLNFVVSDDAAVLLDQRESAGVPEATQKSWNNLVGPEGENDALKDGAGVVVKGMTVSWGGFGSGPSASKAGEPWGFKDGNLKLQQGYIEGAGQLRIQGVPYKKYRIYVYLGAGPQTGKGQVTLESGGASRSYFYKFGWTGGQHVRSEAGELNDIKADSSFLMFENCADSSFSLGWNGRLGGGATGVSGVQIVPQP